MRISEARKFVNGLLDVGETHAADVLSHALDVVVAANASQSADLSRGDYWISVTVPQSRWATLRERIAYFEDD
jgi:hypothetical protein